MASYTDLSPDEQARFLARVLERANNSQTFNAANGLRLTDVTATEAHGELDVTPRHLNPWGFVHGGCLAMIADTVCGAINVCNGAACVTVNCGLNYLRPANGEKIFCAARLVKLGKTISVIDATLTNNEGKEVATGTFTFFRTRDFTEADLPRL